MESYQCNIIVNLSISLEMRRSIVVGWYSMLFKFDNNYAKQHKEQLMEAYHCIITRYLSISLEIRMSFVAF